MSMFPHDRSFAAFLFDMDGTLLTSIKSAERVWTAWAERHGLDVSTFFSTLHGKRPHDTIRQLGLPGVDPIAEAAWITAAEIEDVADIEAIHGAAAFLSSLPPERWGIVTSAPRALAKPDPFLLGARKLGFAPAECLVFEDTQAGLQSAKAAGMDSIVVTLTHTHPMETDVFGVLDYADLRVVHTADGRLKIACGS